MWSTKSAETHLARIGVVRITVVERRARAGENQECVKVCLKQNIDMDPLPDVAAVAHVTRDRIEDVAGLIDAALDREPGCEVSHVIDARHGSGDLLFDLV